MRKKQLSRSFEQLIREIKDSDEFVVHIANIAERYRREHGLQSGPKSQALRQSLRSFHKHAAALSLWLAQSQNVNRSEHDALGKLKASIYIGGADTAAIQTWLSQATLAANEQLTGKKQSKNKSDSSAHSDGSRIAVEGLRATFEHHKLKWSAVVTKRKQSDAVRLLCAIGKHADDVALTPDAAKRALLAD